MDFTILFLQMLLALAVVCVAAVLILKYAVPRLSWAKKWQGHDRFEIISRFNIDAKHALYLVKVHQRFLLLGSSDSGLNLLTELNEAEVAKDSNEKKS